MISHPNIFTRTPTEGVWIAYSSWMGMWLQSVWGRKRRYLHVTMVVIVSISLPKPLQRTSILLISNREYFRRTCDVCRWEVYARGRVANDQSTYWYMYSGDEWQMNRVLTHTITYEKGDVLKGKEHGSNHGYYNRIIHINFTECCTRIFTFHFWTRGWPREWSPIQLFSHGCLLKGFE